MEGSWIDLSPPIYKKDGYWWFRYRYRGLTYLTRFEVEPNTGMLSNKIEEIKNDYGNVATYQKKESGMTTTDTNSKGEK